MPVSKAAKRYATALFETAKQDGKISEIKNDIQFILNTIEDSKDLVRFMRNPVISPSDKSQALDTLFSEHVSPLTHKFIQLLAEKNRTELIREVMNGFIDKFNEDAGIIHIEARSAMKLSDNRIKELQAALEKSTGKSVELTVTNDPSLKGGLLVKMEDTIIDGTVKHKLEQLEQKLLDQTVQLN